MIIADRSFLDRLVPAMITCMAILAQFFYTILVSRIMCWEVALSWRLSMLSHSLVRGRTASSSSLT